MDQRETAQTDCHYQHTLQDAMTFTGYGLRSGRQIVMRIIPAQPDSGIVFVRRDAGDDEIPALWNRVVDAHDSITLSNAHGMRVAAVEYVLAALSACGVDNARIMLDGPEVPVLDGSALPYVSRIGGVGRVRQSAPRRAILVKEAVSIRERDRRATLAPSAFPWISLEFDFEPESIGWQRLSLPVDRKTFADELAPARITSEGGRTGLDGASRLAAAESLQNIVSLYDRGAAGENGSRYPDEYVRHAAVCGLGALALAGARIVGRFDGRRTNHRINTALVRELMTRDDRWQLTTLAEATGCWKKLAE